MKRLLVAAFVLSAAFTGCISTENGSGKAEASTDDLSGMTCLERANHYLLKAEQEMGDGLVNADFATAFAEIAEVYMMKHQDENITCTGDAS